MLTRAEAPAGGEKEYESVWHDAIFPAAFRFHAAQNRIPEVADEAMRILPDPVDWLPCRARCCPAG